MPWYRAKRFSEQIKQRRVRQINSRENNSIRVNHFVRADKAEEQFGDRVGGQTSDVETKPLGHQQVPAAEEVRRQELQKLRER